MNNHVIYLSTCDTCRRILKELNLSDTFELQDIKYAPVTLEQISWLREHVLSYADLLNKRARKLKSLDFDINALSEEDLRDLILSDYTFIKRPIIVFNMTPYIGNSKSVIEELQRHLYK